MDESCSSAHISRFSRAYYRALLRSPPPLSLFTSFLSPLPSSRACIYIFFALPPPLEYFPRAAQRKRFEKENFLNLSRDIYILRARDVSRNNNYPALEKSWRSAGRSEVTGDRNFLLILSLFLILFVTAWWNQSRVSARGFEDLSRDASSRSMVFRTTTVR